ncbi:hypothetical protein [Natronorubrum sp. FCH18a]|uniref:hypothetical protein n=1 Tax=Natronorubrum sp. FCH18a TaxID=3447018 RepID=UPI003F51155D
MADSVLEPLDGGLGVEIPIGEQPVGSNRTGLGGLFPEGHSLEAILDPNRDGCCTVSVRSSGLLS